MRHYISWISLGVITALAPMASATSVKVTATLERGHILSASDLQLASEEDRAALSSYIGMELRRRVYAGYALSPVLVGPPLTVRRNAKVNMVYRIGLLEMSAYGRALGNGAVGDIITVMNLDSRQKVSGVVRKDGSVEVR